MKIYNFNIFSLSPVIFLSLISCNPNKVGKFVASPIHFINAGFEKKSKTELPASWKLVPTEGYAVTQVDDIKHLGGHSLKMVGTPADGSKDMNVSQKVSVDYKQVKRIRVTAYIKTEQLKGNVVLWYNIFDGKEREIDFGNSESLGVMATGTKDWQKYAIDIVLGNDAKVLNFGAYMRGTGTVWFDDFAIEEYEGGSGKPSSEVVKLNTEFIDVVKKNSIYKDSIDWNAVEKDLALLGKGLKVPSDAIILNSYVLQRLRKVGDYHSFIQNKVGAQNYTSGKVTQPEPESKLLTNGIGYISVPSFGSVNEEAVEKFALQIQAMIKELDTRNDIKGWVVDLRTNGGGNMYPMISGLAPLLDTGNLAYFIKGTKDYPLKLTENGMRVNIKDPYKVKNKNNKIAVLIGSKTGSSGEMTAISFIGQHNTKLFGEPSAGYLTSNEIFKISDGSNLVLATSYIADRNRKKYLEKIYPDITVKVVGNGDTVLQKAKSWLAER
ncbi:MAG: S41 family peptidase [Bacteroidota bacterium]